MIWQRVKPRTFMTVKERAFSFTNMRNVWPVKAMPTINPMVMAMASRASVMAKLRSKETTSLTDLGID